MPRKQKEFWMIIPAAGIGSRFKPHAAAEKTAQASKPKQYQKLTSEKTIAQYTIEQVSRHPHIKGLILALNAQDKCLTTLNFATTKPMYRVIGGATRTLSVLHALDFACQEKLVQTEDWILIHDIARPLVSQQEISQLTARINSNMNGSINCSTNKQNRIYQGISLGLPINDSLKRIAEDKQATGTKTILHSEPRERLWRSITPQAAKVGSLLVALKQHQNNPEITDEMSALALIQAPCALIPGDSRNIKITTTEDLELAKSIL